MSKTTLLPIVGLTLALASAVAVSGCSKGDAAKAAAATADATAGAAADGSAPADAAGQPQLIVESSPKGVVLENKIGKRLMNVRISVEIKESPVPFVVVLPTLDKESRLLVDWLRFRSDEAALYDSSAHHPKQVTVFAKDIFSKNYEVTIPWAE